MNKSRWAGLSALLAAVAGGFLIYGRKVEPEAVEVSRLWLRLPRLDPAFDGYRLAQISDIHSDSFMTRDRLARIVEMVNVEEPDLIAITGDLVTDKVAYDAARLVEVLGRLRARDGVVAVLGNHDHRAGAEQVRAVLAEAHIRELPNAVYTLHRGDAALAICGVDDPLSGVDRLDRVLEALPPAGAAILLAHEPDYADRAAATGRFDLQLSGHSHGGQINIPVAVRWALPRKGEKYVRGLHWVNGMALYVNRGVGMFTLPFRFRARPEITLCLLHHETPGESLPPDARVQL